MNDKIFLDTNIIVYSYSFSERSKQLIAQNLIAANVSYISTQVLQELTNTVIRKFKYSYLEAAKAIIECNHNNIVHINTNSTILEACKVADRYGFSFYDSLIIAAAIESECSLLYSEDLTNQQIIYDVLTIINPFTSS